MKSQKFGDGAIRGQTVQVSLTAAWRSCVIAFLIILGTTMNGTMYAQEGAVQTLAERSAIVVRGKVLRTNASEEPLQAASARTLVIKISHMYAGTEIAGDQTGRNATVILSKPGSLKIGTEALFFGNPRFVGKSLTIADEGELISFAQNEKAPSDLERGIRSRQDNPLRERLSIASMVFRGTVESVRPLGGALDRAKKTVEPPSEHDPEWHVAAVRVTAPLLGIEKGALVTVIFSASDDIMWFNSPKLKPGQDALFITHKPTKEDIRLLQAPGIAAFLEKQPAELVIHPFDLLSSSEEERVRSLLPNQKEGKK